MKDGCTITLLKYSNEEIAKPEVQINKRGFWGEGGGFHREHVFDVSVCVGVGGGEKREIYFAVASFALFLLSSGRPLLGHGHSTCPWVGYKYNVGSNDLLFVYVVA
jgi:hypothetical protein